MHGADNDNILKKEDIVRLCIKEMSASLNTSVLVGDTEHDAIGAAKAEIPFIAVTYGFGFKTEKDAENYPHVGIANKPSEIAEVIFK